MFNMMHKYIKFRTDFTLGELEAKFLPKFINKNKKFIFSSLPAMPSEMLQEKVRVTKWEMMDFPTEVPTTPVKQTMFQDSFQYLF